MLEARHLVKRFFGIAVVNDVNFDDVKLIGVVFLASVLAGSFALAWMERNAFETATGHVALLTILLGLSVSVMALDHASRGPAITLDLDEQPALPTQRLDLSQ